jgi:hypothetical protein
MSDYNPDEREERRGGGEEREEREEHEGRETREETAAPKERKQPPNIDGMFTLKIDNISNRVT